MEEGEVMAAIVGNFQEMLGKIIEEENTAVLYSCSILLNESKFLQ